MMSFVFINVCLTVPVLSVQPLPNSNKVTSSLYSSFIISFILALHGSSFVMGKACSRMDGVSFEFPLCVETKHFTLYISFVPLVELLATFFDLRIEFFLFI